MAYIRKFQKADGSAGWQAKLFVTRMDGGKQKRITRNFGDKKSAEQWAARMSIELGNSGAVPDSKITLAQYLERWLEDHKPRLAPSTYCRYRDFERVHITPALGHVKLSRLGQQLVQSFYTNKLSEGRISGSTLLLIHRLLRKALKDATRMGILGRNPIDLLDAPRRNDFEPTVWDPEVAKLFLGEARRTSPHYALYLFSLCTAARPGEALALRWEDVNLTLNTVHIKRKMYRFTEKERQALGLDAKLLVNLPKTRNGIREIPLVGILAEELRRVKEDQRRRQELLGDRYLENGLVFCGMSGKYLHLDVARRNFDKIIERLKLPSIRYYDLRHSAASYLIALGVDVQTVSRIMGHSSAAFTLARYVHSLSGTKADAMKRLEASLFGSPER